MTALLKLFLLPQPIARNTSATADDEIDALDPEDPGYQASFSKLGASERPRPDPVAYVAEPRAYLAQALVTTSQQHPGKITPLVQATGQEFATPFLSYLSSNGFALQ